MPRRAEFLSSTEAHLRESGFKVSRGVELPNGQTVEIFASRTKFSWKGLVILSQHVCVRDWGGVDPGPEDATTLFDASFQQAKKVNRVPLLRGMQFGYTIIPCHFVACASPELVQFAERKPRRRFSLMEFPVVVDRMSGQSHYCKQTAIWGAFYYSDMRKLVERCIVDSVHFQPA